MTSFEITGNDVVVHRWDEDGLHNLKAPGALITKAMNGTDYEDTWPVNDVTYGPTARIDAPAPAVTYTCERTGVSVTTTAPIWAVGKARRHGIMISVRLSRRRRDTPIR